MRPRPRGLASRLHRLPLFMPSPESQSPAPAALDLPTDPPPSGPGSSVPDDPGDRITPPPPVSAPADWGYTVALLLVALIPRLFVALAWAREPVWDGHYYHFGAERIAAGLGYSEDVIVDGQSVWKPWTHYPVGYSALLAFFYRLFGSSIAVAPLVNAIIGTLLAVVVHRLARYALSQNRARIAGALCALHPGLIAYSAVVMTEPTAALFVVGAGWAALSLRHHWTGWLVSGLLIGLGALVRPVSLLALPALLLVHQPSWLRNVGRTALAGIVALLVIAPWTIRNCQRMDGCALISTNGGWNLAIGALTESGRFRTLRADDGCPVVTGQVQQDRCWAEVGMKTIAEDPRRWVAKVPKKLAQTYDHESFPIEYLREAAPEVWPDARRQAGHQLLTGFHWLLMVAAAFSPISLVTSVRRPIAAMTQGLLILATTAYASFCFASPEHPFFALMMMAPLIAVLPFPGRPRLGPAGRYLYFLVFATSVTHAVFFGEDRYHLVISPVLCVLAAGALRVGHQAAQWPPSPRLSTSG